MYRVTCLNPKGSHFVSHDAEVRESVEYYTKHPEYRYEFGTYEEADKVATARAKDQGLTRKEYYIVNQLGEVQEGPVTKKATTSTEDLVTRLMAAVTAEYKDDAPTAGLVFSNLKNGLVYGSVVRYGTQYASSKLVVAGVSAKDFRAAVVALSQEWLAKGVAKQQLEAALKGA